MAPVIPPAFLQAGSYPARLDRLNNAAQLSASFLLGPLVSRSGVKPTPSNTGLQVTQRGTPDRYVSVAAGSVHIAATSALGGTYIGHNDAAYDVQTQAAHASLARKDLIVARIYDAIDDVAVSNTFTIEVITGTPAASPARPATPSAAHALAEVLVPAASTTVVNGNITDLRRRVVSSGGILPCLGTVDLPSAPYPGQTVFREDLGFLQFWTGTVWRNVHDDGFSSMNYGCLAWAHYNNSPNYTTTSTSANTVKVDGTNPCRLAFTMPSGVPATRMVRIEHVLLMTASAAARTFAQSWMDSATNIGFERRLVVPNDGFAWEAHHIVTIGGTVISPGTHYMELQIRNTAASEATTVLDMETSISIL